MQCDGEPGPFKSGPCEMGVYHGPGNRKAAVLIVNKEILHLGGKSIAEAGLQLLPGDYNRSA